MPNDHRVLDRFVYKPVGHCIYCGATDDLGKEHILPFGLSGSAILLESSCRICASITGGVEQEILRGSFWPVRVFRDLKSRSKHADAPTHVPVTLVRDGQSEIVMFKLEEAPLLLPFPIFPPPSHLTQPEPTTGISIFGHHTIRFGTTLEAVRKAQGASEINVTIQLKPVSFARMLAKIAYAFAFAEGALLDLEGESFVLPSILGKRNEIGRWVGTLTKPMEVFPTFLHRIVLHHEYEQELLFAEVQLFADSQTPSYGVVLGKLKPKGQLFNREDVPRQAGSRLSLNR